MPNHYFLRGQNYDGRHYLLTGSVDFRYAFSFPRGSSSYNCCPSAVQGIGIGIHTLSSHKNFGTPVTLYLHQSADILDLSNSISLGYGWNVGAALGWKPKSGTDIMQEDYTNPLVSTRSTVYISVGAYISFRSAQSPTLYKIGPKYTHFSNGDTSYPNHGIDIFALDLEISRNLRPEKHPSEETSDCPSHLDSKQRIRYDLMLYGAWRADKANYEGRPYIINRAFPVAGLMFNPLYSITRNISVGLSADFIYDRSSDLIVRTDDSGELVSYTYPSFSKQAAMGLSLRGELTMPIFSVNLGFGYNLISSGSDLKCAYALFILKTRITERLSLNFGYRLTTDLYVRNLMFGLGWRI